MVEETARNRYVFEVELIEPGSGFNNGREGKPIRNNYLGFMPEQWC